MSEVQHTERNYLRNVAEERLQRRITNAIGFLEDADDRWETLTAAERTAAMRIAVRVVAALARLVLRRL